MKSLDRISSHRLHYFLFPGLNYIDNKMETDGLCRFGEKAPEFIPFNNSQTGLLKHLVVVGCTDGLFPCHSHSNALHSAAVTCKKMGFNHPCGDSNIGLSNPSIKNERDPT